MKQLDSSSFQGTIQSGADPWAELISVEQSSWTSPGKPTRALAQLREAISHLLAQKEGRLVPPLVPSFKPGSEKPNLAQLCKLALLWALLGKKEAAKNLIRWLLPFANRKFFSLWCEEKEYDERQIAHSFSLLFRSLGHYETSAQLLKQGKGPVDPFLIALAKEAPLIDFEISPKESFQDDAFGLKLTDTPSLATAFTTYGRKTSLGVLACGDVEIRAMGPQPFPLNGTDHFGIDRMGGENPSWTRCFADPEVWIEVKSRTEEERCDLELRFVGLKQEEPLGLAFYAKAKTCKIGAELFKPKSLHRFHGLAQSILLQGEYSTLQIESALPHKVQIVPLAGEGCFWDAEFLISFEMHPLQDKAAFTFLSFS